MFKTFKIFIKQHREKYFKASAFIGLTASIAYYWSVNVDERTIYALENDFESKKIKCKNLVKRYKVLEAF